jgi:hypothetical protein
MKMRKLTKAILFSMLVMLPICVFLLSESNVVRHISWFYLAALVLVNLLLYSARDHAQAFFSPSGLMLNYVSVSFFLGSLAFRERLILSYPGYDSYYRFEHLRWASFYFLLCIPVILSAFHFARRWRFKMETRSQYGKGRRNIDVTLAILVLIAFARLNFSIPFWGRGDFSILLSILAALVLSYEAHLSGSKKRFLVYCALFVYFVVFETENKRIAMFYLLTVTFLESLNYRRFPLNMRSLLVALGSLILGVLGIVVMSIYRGFGNYQIGNIFDAAAHLLDYLRSEQVLTLLLHNLETAATYLHSSRAVNHIIATHEYAYGSTFAKALFVPVPRPLFPAKPDSLVELYNSRFYSDFRNIGGSFVPNLLAEAFWNFGLWGGLLSVFILFVVSNIAFNTLISALRTEHNVRLVKYLGAYFFLVYFFRGSGLDGYFALILVLLVFATLFLTFGELLVETGKSPKRSLTPENS